MNKRYLICELLVISLFLAGCWDRYELEERANILGLAIDLADKEQIKDIPEVTHLAGMFPQENRDTIYKVTAQLAVPGKIKLGPEGGSGEGSEKTVWILETYGFTIKDAMANLQQQLAERLYLGHLQIVVLSEDVAKKGIKDINDFLRRDHEVRRTAWMIVNKEDASKVLEAAPPLETVPSLYLSSTLDNAVRFGKLPREYIGKFWIDVSDEGVDGLLPAVQVISNDRIMVDGLAYFEGESMAGRTTPIEIGAYMALKEKTKGGYSVAVSLEDEEGVYLVKSLQRDPDIRVNVENGRPSAVIEVKIDAIIEEETNADDLNEEKIGKIEEAAGDKAEELMNQLLKKLKEDGSDLLGLGGRIRAKYGEYWDREVKTEEKWTEIYKDMDIKVKVDYRIRRTGMEWN